MRMGRRKKNSHNTRLQKKKRTDKNKGKNIS